MSKAEFQLEALTCPTCVKKIETTLTKTDGVSDVKVLFNSSKVKTSFDDHVTGAEEIGSIIQKLGYPVKQTKVS